MARLIGFVSVLSLVLVSLVGCQQPLVGSAAPDFTGQTANGQTFRLSEHTGTKGVVVFFYEQNNCPMCKTQACAFEKCAQDLAAKNYTVVGVNCGTVEATTAFKKDCGLGFPVVADPDGSIAKRFGVPTRQMDIEGKTQLVAARETFVIDKDGTIIGHCKDAEPADHAKRAMEIIESHWSKP